MKPILANYYVTNRCNAKCHFCDIWEDTRSPYIDLKDAADNLRDLKRLGVRFVDFTGGEPLLHPSIETLLKMAKDLGFYTSITSNGMLYPKKAESIKGLVDLLHFSLDSAHKEEHDTHRGVKCFDAVIKSLEVARSLGERPDINFTVRNDNYLELPAVHEIALKYNAILVMNPLFSYGGMGGELNSEVLDYMESFAKRPMTYLNQGFIRLRREGGNHIDKPVCKAVTTTVVISCYNELLLPCYHYSHKKVPIKGRLYELRHGGEVVEAEKMQGRDKFCEGCTINCYFEPSFALSLNAYMLDALPSKIKYGFNKLVRQRFKTLEPAL